MKKALFLLITILFAFLYFSKTTPFYAQETVVQTDTPVGIDTAATPSSATIPERINYELPYPGILPDNPFYFLKVLRDGIVKMLINDPVKKARFSLLNAEKRMYAGKMLVDKGKEELALDTVVKSNNYLDDTINAIKSAKTVNPKNPDIKPFLQQLKTAIKKHIEILGDIKPTVSEKLKQQFLIEESRLTENGKTVGNLLLQK